MTTVLLWITMMILVAVAMWGQYWYDRAKRLQDAIAYMVEVETEESPGNS